ncbi:ATP synthase subunit I [Microbulbifer bruguierae]|uniref:ATP synthase subunit I n=1 Tax=Microbulbifer bruguierae TaxID=3029061 RepID=A0ABY8N9U1_9GAMM|nr:ATP synthase subunit I [Microbulbifer bruguierae]WGL15372.1 ATP synthase subunit I [Microbulbifer bruguierae]
MPVESAAPFRHNSHAQILGGDQNLAGLFPPMRNPPVIKISLIQLAVVVLVAVALDVTLGRTIALSALLGSLLCVLPNLYFGVRAFELLGPNRGKLRGARASQRAVGSFYRAETGKFAMTLVGFALVFTMVKTLNPAALFISYGLCVILQWILVARLHTTK